MIGYPPAFGPVCRGGACPARGYTWALACGEGAWPGVPGSYRQQKSRRDRSPLPAYSISYCPFFCFRVSARCRTAKTGWWNSIRGPLQRMTWRMRSRISGL